MTGQNNDDDDKVGYRKPPKKHQFKKGQSGCPDGGRKQKQAKKDKAQQEEISPSDMVANWFAQKHSVKVKGKFTKMTVLEMALAQLQDDAIAKRDPSARKLLFAIAKNNGWLQAPTPPAKGTGVLVIYSPMQLAEWEKATEGQLLSIDPLEGIPGAEGIDDLPFEGGRKPAKYGCD